MSQKTGKVGPQKAIRNKDQGYNNHSIADAPLGRHKNNHQEQNTKDNVWLCNHAQTVLKLFVHQHIVTAAQYATYQHEAIQNPQGKGRFSGGDFSEEE